MTLNAIAIIALLGFIGLGVGLYFLLRVQYKPQEIAALFSENAALKERLAQESKTALEAQQEGAKYRAIAEEKSLQNKQLFARQTDAEATIKILEQQRKTLTEENAAMKEKDAQGEKLRAQKIAELEAARKALEHEKNRLREQEESRQKRAMEERARQWAEHEGAVKEKLTKAAVEHDFRFFTNAEAPEFLQGKKPDFGIYFLDQVVIFDAKAKTATRPDADMNKTLSAAAKDAAAKYKPFGEVFRTVYFVVPMSEMGSLKKTHWHVDGFDFVAVAPASCDAIFRLFRRMSAYEKLQDFDPMERETLAQLIARYEQMLAFRSAVSLFLTERTHEVFAEKKHLSPAMQAEVEHQVSVLGAYNLKKKEVEILAKNRPAQQRKIQELVNPAPPFPADVLAEAKKLI